MPSSGTASSCAGPVPPSLSKKEWACNCFLVPPNQCCGSGTGSIMIRNFLPDLDPIRIRNLHLGSEFESMNQILIQIRIRFRIQIRIRIWNSLFAGSGSESRSEIKFLICNTAPNFLRFLDTGTDLEKIWKRIWHLYFFKKKCCGRELLVSDIVMDPRCLSQFLKADLYPSWIPDLGSRIRICNQCCSSGFR